MFEVLEHTADTGFRATASSLAGLFAECAMALQFIVLDPGGVQAAGSYPIAAAGEDTESLLVNFLSEVLYYLDGERVAFAHVDITELTANRIVAYGWGERRDPLRHPPKIVVKGVTYHQLEVSQTAEGWRAQVFLDI
jgi:SHS2 domain-containing protein